MNMSDLDPLFRQVDGADLRDASHEQAVEAIRRAANPVVFLVQSIIHRARVRPPQEKTNTHSPPLKSSVCGSITLSSRMPAL